MVIIKLSKLLSPSINSRDVLAILAEEVSREAKPISIDFSGISFISRSAAHELKKLQNPSVKFINLSEDLKQLLSLISSSDPLTTKEERKLPRRTSYENLLATFAE